MSVRWSRPVIAGFELFFRPWLHRRIGDVFVRGELPRPLGSEPVILVANHVSWWDAFILREIHIATQDVNPIYTVMLSSQLARFPFFRRMGVIGIDRDVQSVRNLVRTLSGVTRPFWLTFFPQGAIWPSFRRPLGFERGIELLVRSIAPCLLVPVALHVEPLAKPSPSVFVRIGPVRKSAKTVLASDLENDVETLLDELHEVIKSHGEAAGDVWTKAHSVAV